MKTVERAFGAYVISTDRQRLDLDSIHAFLSTEAYWARGVTRETVERSIAGSVPFGAYRGGAQVGFARVVTDGATFAWLADVYVLGSERGNGLGKEIVRTVVEHPEVTPVRRLMLATADAHGLYEQFGIVPLVRTERFMAKEAGATLGKVKP